jgi:hypothetical protein
MMKIINDDTITTVDELGVVNAKIAELQDVAAALKARLIATGQSSFEGRFYDASVSRTERETLDMAAVRAKLSPQFLRSHTKVTPVTTVRVVAKKTSVKSAVA